MSKQIIPVRNDQTGIRLRALQHAQDLLEEKRQAVAMFGRAVDRSLVELVTANFQGGEDEIYEAEMRLEAAELAFEHEQRLYQSAFDKLAFEVAECERLK